MVAAIGLYLLPLVAVAEWHSVDAAMMGTKVSVRLWHEDPAVARKAAADALAEIERIEDLMSTYRPESRISVLNRDAAEHPVVAGAELFGLLTRSVELSRLSGGAFDVTYESVGQHYDFRQRIKPDDAVLARQRERIDYRLLELDAGSQSVRFLKDGVRINLGGIAKGYAVERAAALLRAHGVGSGLVTAGGDTRLIGTRRGAPWIVGIENPRADGELAVRLPLSDEAISTSGDYERYFDEDGERIHHIIAPSSGKPVEGVRSATVIGPDAVMTDGLSTTIFVLGVEAGLALLERLGDYEGVIIDSSQRLHFSAGLAAPASK